MQLKYKPAVFGVLLLSTTACQSHKRYVETTDTVPAFGGLVHITLINVPNQQKQAILKHINDELSYMQNAFNPWKPGPMGRTNQLLAQAARFSANPSVIPVLIKSQKISRSSHGLFNPAIGRLVGLWGFHNDLPSHGPPPSAAAIQALVKQHPRMSDLSFHGIQIDNTNPAVKIDLNSIAKGYALDFVLNRLKTEGIKNAMLDAGGDIKVLGQHGDKPWQISLHDPHGKGIIAILDAHDGDAVFTSSNDKNHFEFNGKRYCNIIDPRTGYPAQQTRSVTVINHDGALANAAATALFVAGPKQWPQIAKDMGVSQVMLIDTKGAIFVTPQMQQRLKIEETNREIKVVPLP